MPPTPALLIILDGFGERAEQQHNAIALARTPFLDQLRARCPHGTIEASGAAVGLPANQMGNSEVGHLNIGAGRIVYQDLTRISLAIREGNFATNPVLRAALQQAVEGSGRLHVFGLLSDGGVHSLDDHILALLDLARSMAVPEVFLHAFLDGRDTPPKSAAHYLERAAEHCRNLGQTRIASLCGRYWVMDRDNRWDRVQAAYDALTTGQAAFTATDAIAGLGAAYERGETDEFVQPTLIAPTGSSPTRISDGDAVVFMNFRADRAREITRAFTDPRFDGFVRQAMPQLATFTTLTSYSDDFDVPVAFPPETLLNGFGAWLSHHRLNQLRIAETEKYAHVTYFFSGGIEEPFVGEERILVPSPRVATYDEKPEMSAGEVTDRLLEAIASRRFDAIICNYANCDMVGHTGGEEATIRAVEFLDACLARVVPAMQATGGEVLITADHGNADKMWEDDNKGGHPHTAHTTNPVPVIYVGRPATLEAGGALRDIAPTLLAMMGLDQPDEMTGRSLVSFS